MTHDELLSHIDDLAVHDSGYGAISEALRAVVELHTPILIDSDVPIWCTESCGSYPCNTIQAIEKELR